MAVLVAVCGKPQLMRVVLLLNFCAAVVYSSHFRGGVIMVKPKPGGTAREVSQLESSYTVHFSLAWPDPLPCRALWLVV